MRSLAVFSLTSLVSSRWLGVALGVCAGVGACAPTSEDAIGQSKPAHVTVPAEPSLRRLLARHYRRSVGRLLGSAAQAAASPPADTQLNGFTTIAASQLSFNDSLVGAYESSARAIAAAAMLDTKRIAELVDCKPVSAVDTNCFGPFVDTFGRLAWRRPVTSAEREDYVALAKQGAAVKADFFAGVELAISAILQSPNFLYQVEVGRPNPTRSDVRDLTGYEVATRLSFLLAGVTPDAALLDAAERGELDDEAGVRKWASVLVALPESATAVRDFFEELLVLGELPTLAKDPNLFPEFSPELAMSMREEALRIVEDVVRRDAPITEILTTSRTFLDAPLASFYGVGAPAEAWGVTTLPEAQGRSGVLTSAAVMTRQAHSTTTSATYRGLFVMERFLCTTMPPPPPGVVTNLPPSSAAPTLRERLEVHQADPVCRACHYMADGLGLTFENFDAVGKFRETENGAAIDTRAAIELLGTWDAPRGLAEVLAASDAVKSCMLQQLYRYAAGHVEQKSEWPAINELLATWSAEGHSFRALMVDLASHELFRRVGTPQ